MLLWRSQVYIQQSLKVAGGGGQSLLPVSPSLAWCHPRMSPFAKDAGYSVLESRELAMFQNRGLGLCDRQSELTVTGTSCILEQRTAYAWDHLPVITTAKVYSTDQRRWQQLADLTTAFFRQTHRHARQHRNEPETYSSLTGSSAVSSGIFSVLPAIVPQLSMIQPTRSIVVIHVRWGQVAHTSTRFFA